MPKTTANRSLFVFAAVIAAVLYPASAVYTHDEGGKTAAQIEEHRRIDAAFPGFDKLSQKLSDDYKNFDFAAAAEAYKRAMAAPGDANSHLVGEWSSVVNLPIVAIHNALLPDGRIVMWDSVGDMPTEYYPVHNTTRAIIWDPTNGNISPYDVNTGYNLFCAGHSILADGKVFIAGGNLNSALDGLNALHIFDPAGTPSKWKFLGPMSQGGRWYPSVTELANGEMLITSGGPATPEVYNPQSGLRTLTNATLQMPLYPWLLAAPNGKTVYFGPANDFRYLDTTGSGAWLSAKQRDGLDRNYGSYASFDIGKILVAGGGEALRSSVVLDINNGSSRVSAAGDLITGRRQHNLTVLPDGTVLATGGLSSSSYLVDLNAGVYTAELWDPATGLWKGLSSMQRTRQYHSMALLMPDGRVLVGGGGICGACHSVGYLEKNIEIFTPPYLFKKDGSGTLAARPSIRSAPATLGYRQNFSVSAFSDRPIRDVVLMRPASVTHSVNFDQRRIPLRISNAKKGFQVTSPTDSSVAPPGYYMLFIIDDQGVPSVGKMVKVG